MTPAPPPTSPPQMVADPNPAEGVSRAGSKWPGFAVRRGFAFNVSVQVNRPLVRPNPAMDGTNRGDHLARAGSWDTPPLDCYERCQLSSFVW
jgi:hypothetical protein